MALSYGEGVAVGMLAGDASSARSDAEYQRSRASRLQRENDDLKRQIAALQNQVSRVSSENTENLDQAIFNARQASAGLIVMNGMIKAMQYLPSDLREKFRTDVVTFASSRFDELDPKYRAEAANTNKIAMTIRDVFSKDSQYKTLGFGN